MGSGYRGEFWSNRLYGQAIQAPYKEHNKEYLLELMRSYTELSEMGYDEPFMREESICEDLLLFLKREEVLERGIYSWNRPDMDLAIVAPPPLMALILGEYSLAARLCEICDLPTHKMMVDEMYQEGNRSFVGGGHYGFCEACLFSSDMSLEEKQFFHQIGGYESRDSEEHELGFMEGFQFHQRGAVSQKLLQTFLEEPDSEQISELWKPIIEVQNLQELFQDTSKLISGIVQYALRMKLDIWDVNFWEKLFKMFSKKEAHHIIVDAMHGYMRNMESWQRLPQENEELALKCLKVYFRYEDSLPMEGEVEAFLSDCLYKADYMAPGGKCRQYMEQYLRAVKNYGGGGDPVLETGDVRTVGAKGCGTSAAGDALWFFEGRLYKRLCRISFGGAFSDRKRIFGVYYPVNTA